MKMNLQTSKSFAPLTVILFAFMTLGLILAARHIVSQNNEINSLQNRVENLETVVNHDYLLPAGYNLPDDAI